MTATEQQEFVPRGDSSGPRHGKHHSGRGDEGSGGECDSGPRAAVEAVTESRTLPPTGDL